MAEDLGSEETPQMTVTPPSTPLSSLPLQLSGFLNGDTIQVEGDTGNLQFSVKLNIHNKYSPNGDTNFHFPSSNSSFSSYMTPKSTQHIENQIVDFEPLTVENHGTESESTVKTDTTQRRAIVTRLKSGAVSQAKYFPRKESKGLRSCRTMKGNRKKGEREDIVLEKLLMKRSCPVRPCSSYVFFVMTSWGLVKSSSFGEASKKLSQMWGKLSPTDKKTYEDVALRDSARYKRQCKLLNCKRTESVCQSKKQA